MRVGILGGGRWGQALARLVQAAGNEPYIAYQGKRPPHVLPSTDVPRLVPEACDLVLVATSAAEVRQAIVDAAPGPGNRVVVAGRGLEPATSQWLADVVAETCPAVRTGALAGPAPVDEILNGGLCAGVIASPYAEVRALVTAALHSSRYRVYESSDLTGVQLAGAVVPVLQTTLGMAISLQGSGAGLHALVLTRGLEEAGRLARAMGADPLTLLGLAGVGDLTSTLTSAPAYQAGKALAAGQRDAGPAALARALLRLAGVHRVELPLTQGLVAVYDGAHPIDVVQRLMARRAQPEHR